MGWLVGFIYYFVGMSDTVKNSVTFGVGSTTRGFIKNGRIGGYLLAAGLITGVHWYFQTRLAWSQQARQKEIIKRVNDNVQVNINDLLDITKVNQHEGAKIKVAGALQPGRFVIKRKRGDQEGYIVLAPFVVREIIAENDRKHKSLNQKYMLNLGWVPKDSKHKIRQTAAIDILQFSDLPEEQANDEDATPSSYITAFVRKGEQRDILRGRNNWTQDELYKYIDLGFMEKLFHSSFPSFRHIYLDRIAEQGSVDAFPFANNNEHYIEQLNQETKQNNKKRALLSTGVGVASFATAALLAVFS